MRYRSVLECLQSGGRGGGAAEPLNRLRVQTEGMGKRAKGHYTWAATRTSAIIESASAPRRGTIWPASTWRERCELAGGGAAEGGVTPFAAVQ